MPRKPKTPSSSLPLDSVRHKDKRANIPTEELRDFVREEEAAIKNVTLPGLLYARDPSLDPQLVWRGKDDQDREQLTVPAVPIYIQEKIHPQAIIEDVRAAAKKEKPDQQFSLFSDFNGIAFEDMIDFYHHESNWSNRMILGDSLLTMTSLAEKEGLKGKVQMIYIDPPYGIKFGSNWQVSTRKRDVKDGKAEDCTRQPEQIRAFRDTWELGIHSYLSYWRDRLIIARELLTETGSVFVQIGDENVHLVRNVMDEVFGTENFVCQIFFRKKLMPLGGKTLETMGDYLLWYARDRENVRYRQLYAWSEPDPSARWTGLELNDGVRRPLTTDERADTKRVPTGSRIYSTVSQAAPSFSSESVFRFSFQGKVFLPPHGQCWVTSQENMVRLSGANRLEVEGGIPRYVMYHDDFPWKKITNPWTDTAPSQNNIYVVQTNERVIERCLLMTTDPGDLVLDPTCGSGTTAYVAEQWGRRWITIDTSRVALALARTRLMTGRFPYYLLSDSPEGQKKEAEAGGQTQWSALTQSPSGRGGAPSPPSADIKKGFVYKRVPHITLKSIANNEDIDAIHAKWQQKLEPIRAQLNKLLGTEWEEWQVPRELSADCADCADSDKRKKNGSSPKSVPLPSGLNPAKSAEKASSLLAEWWRLRRERQAEIDASIARRADTELLYDQPYEDAKRIRVTGPFTVESLSPHRTISVEAKKQDEETGYTAAGYRVKELGPNDFARIIIDNLKKAGVQNTIKGEKLVFDRLEPFAGTWIHAEGSFLEKDGTARRAAVCIGPEHGTVGPALIKEAAKEAVQGIGFDVLVVCGFAFDPLVSEESKRYGKLTVLPARINADLQMGAGFFKKTISANLFMVFGEPDIDVKKGKDGKIVVKLNGLDIYDPTTGQIRSNSTDDIACWFIDTNYNAESFFVRHAYFTGADQPYDKLKRALRAEIDEAAWSQLYTTASRPFDPPETGKIAVKVINHYGDEVVRVYGV